MNIKELDEYWINTDLKSFIQEIVFGWCSSWWCRHWSEASANIQLQLNRCDIVTRIDGELILQLLQGGITQILHHNHRNLSFIIHLLPMIFIIFIHFLWQISFFSPFSVGKPPCVRQLTGWRQNLFGKKRSIMGYYWPARICPICTVTTVVSFSFDLLQLPQRERDERRENGYFHGEETSTIQWGWVRD